MLILDTHALIWSLYDYEKIPERTRNSIKESDRVCASIVSLWEIAIKQSIGKLQLKQTIEELEEECIEQSIEIMPIYPRHLEQIKQLPMIHKDPFDRLLVAQAQCEGLTIVTKDRFIPQYDIGTLW